MIELEYHTKLGALELSGTWDPALRSFDGRAEGTWCGLDLGPDAEDVAARILAMDRGWSITAAEDRIADDADEQWEPPDCGNCSGSGEGMYDGTRCSSCGGSGVERVGTEAA